MTKQERRQRIKAQNEARKGKREARSEMTRAEFEMFVEASIHLVGLALLMAGVDPRGLEMERLSEMDRELRNDYVN